VPAPYPMHLLYLTHDITDPATHKRVAMLVAGGAKIHLAGFSRTAPPPTIAGCEITDFGRTHNGRFIHRILSVLRVVATLARHRELFRSTDVILARNLEMLGIAVRGRSMCANKPPIAYEVLDIHRLMLREDSIGKSLRALEGWLARRVSLIITSSPAFMREYFEKRTTISAPLMLLENKVFTNDTFPTHLRPAGPPWRIGWFGAIRCRKSLDLLSEAVRQHPELLEVIIRGRPAYDQLPEFDARIGAADGIHFKGAYRPEELPAIYHDVHFSWAIDMFEEGLNSSWLLPNRIYEGGLYGAIPLAAACVETSRFITQHGIGHTLDEPKDQSLLAFLKNLTPASYQAMAAAVARVDARTWRCDVADCKALVERLNALTSITTPTIPVADPSDPLSPLVVIPCLNEAHTLEPLVEYLLSESATPMDIVIADGGSTDGTVAIAQRLAATHATVHYLHNPKRIQSAAVNLAVATFGSTHTHLLRIDAHADYPRGFCTALLADAARTGADSVVVSMNTVGKAGFQEAVAAAQNSKLGNGGAAHRFASGEGKWVDHGHHAVMRIAAYRAIGGYDENFTHNEDAELDVRLRRAGGRIWLSGATSMDYYPRATPMALFKQYRNYGRGRVRNLLKHREKPKLRQMLPVAVTPAILMLPVAILLPIAALPCIAWAGLCLLYGAQIARTAKNRMLLLSGPAAMIMHAGWSLGFWQGAMTYARHRP